MLALPSKATECVCDAGKKGPLKPKKDPFATKKKDSQLTQVSPQVTLFFLAALAITINGKPAPNAEPKAFFGTGLGAIALPAITNSALIDGLLLGKVAFLKGERPN